MGVPVGKGYTPKQACETVKDRERTGESQLLQVSKKCPIRLMDDSVSFWEMGFFELVIL